MMHDLNYENGTLSIFSYNGSMGIFGSIKMKYDAVKRDLKIIKYEDNAGSKTITFKVWQL
jgi:hypothetical protein